MSYDKHSWASKEVISTTKLNHIEDGIEDLNTRIVIQSDWDQTDSEADDYIKNKPDVVLAKDIPNWVIENNEKPIYTANEVGAVPTSRTINGKILSSNINLNASDVGASSATNLENGSQIGSIQTTGSIAGGEYAQAQNKSTLASSNFQTALGKFNIEDTDNTYAEIIGNGTSNNSRSNALTVDWNGRIECGDYSGNLRSIFDIFYPVGSYYETSDSIFNPNTIWGGSWILETEGLVHVSGSINSTNYPVSGTYTNANYGKGKQQGGDKDAIVPSHHHNIKVKTTKGPSNNTSGPQSQNHTHSPSNATNFMYYDNDVPGAQIGRRNNGSGSGDYYSWTSAKLDGLRASIATSGANQGHTHSLQGHTHILEAHNTEDEGVSATDKNMQPYINIYRWHRVA